MLLASLVTFSGFLTAKGFERLHFDLWETFHARLRAEGRNPEVAPRPAQVVGNVEELPQQEQPQVVAGGADDVAVPLVDAAPAAAVAAEGENRFDVEETHKSRKLTGLREQGLYPGYLPWEKMGYFDELQKVTRLA